MTGRTATNNPVMTAPVSTLIPARVTPAKMRMLSRNWNWEAPTDVLRPP